MATKVIVTAKARNELVNVLAACHPTAAPGTAVPMTQNYLDLIEAELATSDGRPRGRQ